MRRPIVWCEIGSCVPRYEDPAALGEADFRSREHRLAGPADGAGRVMSGDGERVTVIPDTTRGGGGNEHGRGPRRRGEREDITGGAGTLAHRSAAARSQRL